MAPIPHAGPKEPAVPDFKDACRRIDEVAEVIQPPCLPLVLTILFKELAAGGHESRDEVVVELLELCGRWCTVPTSYKLEGVEKRGLRAQHVSPTTKIWKGRYRGKEVALKVLRVRPDNPLPQTVKSVSASHSSRTSFFFGVMLTGGIGILQGSSFNQAG